MRILCHFFFLARKHLTQGMQMWDVLAYGAIMAKPWGAIFRTSILNGSQTIVEKNDQEPRCLSAPLMIPHVSCEVLQLSWCKHVHSVACGCMRNLKHTANMSAAKVLHFLSLQSVWHFAFFRTASKTTSIHPVHSKDLGQSSALTFGDTLSATKPLVPVSLAKKIFASKRGEWTRKRKRKKLEKKRGREKEQEMPDLCKTVSHIQTRALQHPPQFYKPVAFSRQSFRPVIKWKQVHTSLSSFFEADSKSRCTVAKPQLICPQHLSCCWHYILL